MRVQLEILVNIGEALSAHIYKLAWLLAIQYPWYPILKKKIREKYTYIYSVMQQDWISF